MNLKMFVVIVSFTLFADPASAAVSYDVVAPKTVQTMQAQVGKSNAAVERQFPLDLGNGNKVMAKFRIEPNGLGVLSSESFAVVLIKPNAKGEAPIKPLNTKLTDLNKDGVKDIHIWGDVANAKGVMQSVTAGFVYDAVKKRWKSSYASPEIEYSVAGAKMLKPQ